MSKLCLRGLWCVHSDHMILLTVCWDVVRATPDCGVSSLSWVSPSTEQCYQVANPGLSLVHPTSLWPIRSRGVLLQKYCTHIATTSLFLNRSISKVKCNYLYHLIITNCVHTQHSNSRKPLEFPPRSLQFLFKIMRKDGLKRDLLSKGFNPIESWHY